MGQESGDHGSGEWGVGGGMGSFTSGTGNSSECQPKSRKEETLTNTWCTLHHHFPDCKTKIRMHVADDTCKELTGPLTKAKHRPQS